LLDTGWKRIRIDHIDFGELGVMPKNGVCRIFVFATKPFCRKRVAKNFMNVHKKCTIMFCNVLKNTAPDTISLCVIIFKNPQRFAAGRLFSMCCDDISSARQRREELL